MTDRQTETKKKIFAVALMIGINPNWALAIADQESSLGEHQLSPTGAKGVFQMTRIAMMDLIQEMAQKDDDMIDICCGILFLRLLLKRHGSIEAATGHYCDPNDKPVYVPSVMRKMAEFSKEGHGN
jgi:hypothetical protein